MELITIPFHYIKKFLKFLFSRTVIIALLILLQIGIFLIIPAIYRSVNSTINFIFRLLSAAAVFWIVSKDENPYFKISWICLFFFFPLIGVVMYLLFSNRPVPKKLKMQMKANHEEIEQAFSENMVATPTYNDNILQSKYVKKTSSYPTLANTKVEYYSLGEYMFKAIIEDLKSAQKYIFLEFFIVAKGTVMNQILEVLTERIAKGVKVYFMYDDIGSLVSVPHDYVKHLDSLGINAFLFNPFRPTVNPVLNYRDHRKIVVVDGEIAYSGGMNLADEYINKKERFGHWKDTGVRLEGDGAWPFGLMFLQQWQFATGHSLNVSDFTPQFKKHSNTQGYVQSYGDDPLSKFKIAENTYLNAIWQAKNYIYITTPYLIIDNVMEGALCSAAISGVDVRIILPKVYDKWYVHMVTRSNYRKLIENGVKIYEYTPGFIHSKMFVSDDIIAMVGTSNMDFRSFYHHFECSVLIYENEKNKAVKQDILDCTGISHLMTIGEIKRWSIFTRIGQRLLRLVAPLL